MSVISSVASSLNARPTETSPSGGSQSVDFMKLLMAQMQNQNPMDPQTGTEFMTQIAQFSQLEGINKINKNFSDMMMLQGITQGAGLIGKNVTFARDASGATTRGVVNSVIVNGGKVQLNIGGAQVDLSQIRSIEAGPRTANTV